MKKFLFTLILTLSFSLPTTPTAAKNPAKKLFRGLVNIATAPLELVYTGYESAKWLLYPSLGDMLFFKMMAPLQGVSLGIGNTAIRAISGAWDVATFPFEFSEEYEPIFKPDYVFERFSKNKDKKNDTSENTEE